MTANYIAIFSCSYQYQYNSSNYLVLEVSVKSEIGTALKSAIVHKNY